MSVHIVTLKYRIMHSTAHYSSNSSKNHVSFVIIFFAKDVCTSNISALVILTSFIVFYSTINRVIHKLWRGRRGQKISKKRLCLYISYKHLTRNAGDGKMNKKSHMVYGWSLFLDTPNAIAFFQWPIHFMEIYVHE